MLRNRRGFRSGVATPIFYCWLGGFAVPAILSGPALAQNTNMYCGTIGGETQGKPGYRTGGPRVGTCGATAKWRCNPSIVEVTADGGSADTYRVVTFSIGDSTTSFTHLHQSDRIGTAGISGFTEPVEEPKVTECLVFKYEKIAGGYEDASDKKDASEQTKQDDKSPENALAAGIRNLGSMIGNLFNQASAAITAAINNPTPAPSDEPSVSSSSSSYSPPPDTSPGESSTNPEINAAGLQLFGAILGGIVAGRTGNTALMDAFTGQSASAMVPQQNFNAGGGNCEQVQAAAARQAKATGWSQSCAQNRQTVGQLRGLTNQVVNACGGSSSYGRMWQSELQQAEANLNSGIRNGVCR
jgi:hypothetical protein